ncbi:MAG: CHASE3 domain-containing protein [Terracidiphilus sp.]
MNSAVQRFGVVTAFTLLALLLIGNTLVTRRQLAVQTDRQRWLVHTRLVRYEIQQTLAMLEDAETGQRGYLYTGEPRYLEPYNRATQQIEEQLRQLSDLTADDPAQIGSVVRVRTLAHQKLQEMAATIALYRAGKNEEARKLVLSGRGLEIMESLRNVLGQMEQEEEKVEDAQSAAYERSIERTVNSIYLATGLAILGLAFVAHFILRQRRMRERYTRQLRAREEWFRVTLQSIGDGVIATDEAGKVTFLNPIATALTGVPLEDALQRDIHEVFPIFNEHSGAVAENPVQRVMSLGIVVGLANHTVLRHQSGHLTPIEDSAAPIRDDRNKIIGVVLVFRDAALERKSQELMRRAEKLAAAARLSATVAHEINNPLEAVINLVFLAKMLPCASPAVIEKLDLAEQELDRVSHIARQTLGFYRESSVPARTEIRPLLDSVLSIYTNKIKTKEIQPECITADCPPFYCIQGELKQLLANLIANAIDAVGHKGRICITANFVHSSANPVMEISIQDDGPGIASELSERIFEPFFTTKKDVGNGLGLWVAREIAVRLGGSLALHTDTSGGLRGAHFVLQVPCTLDEPIVTA